MPTPDLAQLKKALAVAEEIEKLQTELASFFGGRVPAASVATSVSKSPAKRGGKRTFSPAALARMRAAQQARWAKVKGTSAPVSIPTKQGGKRFVSAESRAKMAAAQHARWARNNPSAPAKAPKKKGGLSPEGRARIVAALKARHAAAKLAKVQ